METLRRYYTFCIENQHRLVIYRRNDAEWVELASKDVGTQKNIVPDELIAIDGLNGRILNRKKLPIIPREDLIRTYGLSYETAYEVVHAF